MKRVRSFGFVFALACSLGSTAIAQDSPASADVQDGRAVARGVCSVCHIVPAQPRQPMLNPPAPSFRAIANRPGTTAESLLVFLATTHKTVKTYRDMPAPGITDDQTHAVVRYILSLRRQP